MVVGPSFHSPKSGQEEPFVVRSLGPTLVGLRARELRVLADLLRFTRAFSEIAEPIVASLVVCADYSAMMPMSEEVAEAFVAGCRSVNPRLRRSAVILPTRAAILRLQMDRIIREAKHPERRICTDAAEAKAWLSPCLDPTEMVGLDRFLG